MLRLSGIATFVWVFLVCTALFYVICPALFNTTKPTTTFRKKRLEVVLIEHPRNKKGKYANAETNVTGEYVGGLSKSAARGGRSKGEHDKKVAPGTVLPFWDGSVGDQSCEQRLSAKKVSFKKVSIRTPKVSFVFPDYPNSIVSEYAIRKHWWDGHVTSLFIFLAKNDAVGMTVPDTSQTDACVNNVGLKVGIKVRSFSDIIAASTVAHHGGDGTILDLGTNVGWFASVGLALGHDRVFGVEANTELCTILECLATKNGWRDKLVLYNAAITDEDTRVGNVSLTFTVDNSAPGQSFSAKDGVFTSSKHSLKNITIPGGNLEFMLPTKPYIVKIDIQGMERPAMKTLRAHMLKHDYAIKHVLVEIDFRTTEENVANTIAEFEAWQKLGYAVFVEQYSIMQMQPCKSYQMLESISSALGEFKSFCDLWFVFMGSPTPSDAKF